MSEVKTMSSIQFPNTDQPYQVNDSRIPANPGAYKQMVTGADGNWVAEDRLAYKDGETTHPIPAEYITGTPLTEQDNGKVMTVENGKWEATVPLRVLLNPEISNYGYNMDNTIIMVSSTTPDVGEMTFQGCSWLMHVHFPVAKYLYNGAFTACDMLQEAIFPEVHTLYDFCFAGCRSLKTAIFPKATSIPRRTLAGCESLLYVHFPMATSIGEEAFQRCYSLRKIRVPAATTVGAKAFETCTALEKVVLPSVTSIDASAFNYCTSLQTLVLGNENSVCEYTGTLQNCPISRGTGYIYVPTALVDTYKATQSWSRYSNQIRAIEDNPWVMDEAFPVY